MGGGMIDPRNAPASMMIEGRDYEFHEPLTRREALRRTLADVYRTAVDIWRYYRGRRPLLCMPTEDQR